MDEIWKPIANHPNYEASNLGRIRCVEYRNEGILDEDKDGKVMVLMGNDLIPLRRDLLVARTFLKEPASGSTIHHINGNTSDCNVENLEWVRIDRRTRVVDQYNKDGTFIREYVGVRAASDDSGISYQGILNCCRRIQVSAGGYMWCYHGENVPQKEPDPELDCCPRCGGKAKYKVVRLEDGTIPPRENSKYKVECIECGIQTPICNSKKQASHKWNREKSSMDSLMELLNS